MTNTPYIVDGHEFDDLDSDLAGDGQYAPFWVFNVDAQDYQPKTYATREEAQAVADTLNSAITA